MALSIQRTQTCKQEYASAMHIKPYRGLQKREIPLSGICPASSLYENVVFSVCARMGNAAYIMLIMWNSISGLDTWYHFRFNINCGVAVTVRSHKKKFR